MWQCLLLNNHRIMISFILQNFEINVHLRLCIHLKIGQQAYTKAMKGLLGLVWALCVKVISGSGNTQDAIRMSLVCHRNTAVTYR